MGFFTFSWWGSAGVGASASVPVSLHAAGAAPAAPAPPAGPHAPWRAAGVRARLADAPAAPLCGALPSGASGIHTCCTPVRPVRLNPSVQLVRQQKGGGSPFCLGQLSGLGPNFGASDLVLLQQRLLLWVPLLLRSPGFQSGSFSLSGITTTSCSRALQQQ